MLTIPSLFRKVVNVRFLCAKSGCHLEVCMEDIPYIKLREQFIQSYQLLIAAETAPILLSTELFKSGSQLTVRGVLKCVKCQACQHLKDQTIHFLTPYWLLPLRLDILKAADTGEMKFEISRQRANNRNLMFNTWSCGTQFPKTETSTSKREF
jgi:hypothetical protein